MLSLSHLFQVAELHVFPVSLQRHFSMTALLYAHFQTWLKLELACPVFFKFEQ
jgi:hypothetical protein